MKIYTRTGDKGETSLFSGERVKKYDGWIDCLGEVDELCSYLGLIKSLAADPDIWNFINGIQQDGFNVMAMLSTKNDKKYHMDAGKIVMLEAEIDRIAGLCPERKGFIIPGGNTVSAHIDIARTIVRRVERKLCALDEVHKLDGISLTFINRLSDYLFTLARYAENNADSFRKVNLC